MSRKKPRRASKLRAPRDGRSSDPLYPVWNALVSRVLNPNNKDFERYSKLGIWKQWAEDFYLFTAWVGEKPFEGATIDRIRNDWGYLPGNLRWATRKEQIRNSKICLPDRPRLAYEDFFAVEPGEIVRGE